LKVTVKEQDIGRCTNSMLTVIVPAYRCSTGVGGGHTSGSLVGSSYSRASELGFPAFGLSLLRLDRVPQMSLMSSYSCVMSCRACSTITDQNAEPQYSFLIMWLYDSSSNTAFKHPVCQLDCMVSGKYKTEFEYGI